MKQTSLSPQITLPLIPSGSAVVCALSGGADSVCLLHLLSQREDISLSAAHFNHCLRGEGSDGDEEFVRDLCRELNIPLTVGRGDVSGFARSENCSVEDAARTLRYRFLRAAAPAGALIATAHNAEDNAETVLWNLIRGSGLTGLTGIPPRRDNIVRPLLSVSRREITAYLLQNGLPHREDPTNAETLYTRNRLRHQVLPLLRELNPKAVEHIGQTAERLRSLDEGLDGELERLLPSITAENGQISVPRAVWENTPEFLRPKLLLNLLDRAGISRKNIGAVHLESILSLPPNGTATLPNGLTAHRVYDDLVLSISPTPPAPLPPTPLRKGENPVPATRWSVILEGEPWDGLTVRARQTGDTLTLPNGHTKRLKKLLIDRKIPRSERDTLPVVADKDGILAVAGIGENTAHPRRSQIKIIQTERGDRV